MPYFADALQPFPMESLVWRWDWEALEGEEDREELFDIHKALETDRLVDASRETGRLYRLCWRYHPDIRAVERCVKAGADVLFEHPRGTRLLHSLLSAGAVDRVRVCLEHSPRSLDFRLRSEAGTVLFHLCEPHLKAEDVGSLLELLLQRMMRGQCLLQTATPPREEQNEREESIDSNNSRSSGPTTANPIHHNEDDNDDVDHLPRVASATPPPPASSSLSPRDTAVDWDWRDDGGKDFLALAASRRRLSVVWPLLRRYRVPYYQHLLDSFEGGRIPLYTALSQTDWAQLTEEEQACFDLRIPIQRFDPHRDYNV